MFRSTSTADAGSPLSAWLPRRSFASHESKMRTKEGGNPAEKLVYLSTSTEMLYSEFLTKADSMKEGWCRFKFNLSFVRGEVLTIKRVYKRLLVNVSSLSHFNEQTVVNLTFNSV